MNTESVVVIGAGIGGLCTALELAPTGRKITILERDGAPPDDDPDIVFNDWKHTGVGQLRQSHAFLARLRTIIKSKHPRLLEAMLTLGVRELRFESMLTDIQRKNYTPSPGDAELTIITSRRTTLELAMRHYVETLDGVTILSGVSVRTLLTDKGQGGCSNVFGVSGICENEEITVKADVVVDASGKGGFLIDQIREQSCNFFEEKESAGILYFTRHYRLKNGVDEPGRIANPPPTGDLGFLKFGVFPGDNGCFSITLAMPEVEMELRQAILSPDLFHRITLLLPGLAVWTNSDVSEPLGRVHGMGDLVSQWRDLVVDGKPAALGYFALGDTLIRANPLYGRGCSFAAVGAQLLRQTLDQTSDPETRALAFHERVHAELKPFYINQRSQDRAAIKRARLALIPTSRKRGVRKRLMRSFFEHGIRIALRYDTDLLRDAMRGFHMLEPPDKWLGKPKNLVKVLYYWMRGKKRNSKAYPPNPGPKRKELMNTLGINSQADIDRLAQDA